MKRENDELRVTATDLATFAECAHATTLDVAHVAGAIARPFRPNPGAVLLRARGSKHERAYLASLLAEGRDVLEIPFGPEGTNEAIDRTRDAMRRGVDVIYQGALAHARWFGRPDFVVKVDVPSALGAWSYEIVDTKLARVAKPSALLQVCAYADLLERAQGLFPAHVHLVLGDSRRETFATAGFAAYFRRVRRSMERALGDASPTYPEPVSHCSVCDWFRVCDGRWREDDHLSLVAGITTTQRRALEMRDVRTTSQLAGASLDGASKAFGVGRAAFTRIREQARIQVAGRASSRPLYELLPRAEDRGLSLLPLPSRGDLFLDFEGDPYAVGDGLEYLIGFAERAEDGADGALRYTSLWSFDRKDERLAFAQLMSAIAERRARHPAMHVYHYAPYETTALKRLAGRHAIEVDALDALLRGKVFVDLYTVLRQGLRASVESYSIKRVEALYGFERTVPLRDANACLNAFETWLELREPDAPHDEMRAGIEGYNEDDCLSTLHLRDWLEARRDELASMTGSPLPRPLPAPSAPSEALAEQVERARAVGRALLDGLPDDEASRSPEEQARYVAAHLLEWHRREDKSDHWEYFRLCDLSEDELHEDRTALSGLTYEGIAREEKRSHVHRYAFPPQDHAIDRALDVHDPKTRASAGTLVSIDDGARALELKRLKTSSVPHPTALVPRDLVPNDAHRESLLRLGELLAQGAKGDHDAPYAAAIALLKRSLPRSAEAAPTERDEKGDSERDAIAQALAVRGSVLPVQGPPGTGKTYLAARMIVALVRAGKQIGITANSHKVITNLLDEACRAAEEAGVPLRAIQKAKDDEGSTHPLVDAATDNAEVRDALASRRANVGAATSWLWAREEMMNSVDVLFIDEAGQMSLANALASAPSSRGLVLLGDPQQLEQPQKGVHPEGAAASALGHVLGHAATIDAKRGLFLERSWRMHPAVCRFISEVFYEGRLHASPTCDRIRLDAAAPFGGTGLRFVPVAHRANRSESPEEARVVARLVASLTEHGATWTDRHGTTRALSAREILVVAPYNAHVARLRAELPAGARVGTVDKFQGQEAPVVIYTMATSSPEDAPRGADFLYSGHRFNVAVSRAQCAAFLVASPLLFEMHGKTAEEMILVNAFCRYLEEAREIGNI